MSTDETSPVTGRPRRPRRERGVTETLLSIVLVLEAVVLFFATLAINGLTDIPTEIVVGGGVGAIVVFVVVATLQRFAAGVVLGGVLQLVLIASGFLAGAMFVVGAVFAALWVWCLVRARRIEDSRRMAAEGGDA
ncbi:DUF4233 domain-containing protein [Pseudolysinimonas sp.]|uniref:DUF4233 domain-containing protein n=1 Tax=Pseudolysinimonas sp. TaxID=2680009 RepID=UPI002869F808|nr:DUF4233 domain-containing protein [Pseudolysinimonas sp.]